MKKILLSIYLLLIYSINYAQDEKSLLQIKQETNINELKKFSELILEQTQKNRENAYKIGKEKGWLLRSDDEFQTIELQGLYPNGKPFYYSSSNLNAARTTSTIKLWPGRALGLNLTGIGIKLGEWDGGKVRATHQDLNGRITQRDGATTLNDHATHVAGTIMASGNFDTTARGMAWQAQLDTYDWVYDVAEMSLAAAEGLLLSNHSYVTICGWQYQSPSWYWWGDTAISGTEDFNFGFYEQTAKYYDYISYNAPYYLIVKAAGNNNTNGPPSGTIHYVWNGNNWVLSSKVRPKIGTFDCLPTYSVAKNILTIGNADDIYNGYQIPSDVLLFATSSCGPTDDGRIKPDICGNGVGLKSTIASSNTAYASYSGTSMASPNVTGTLALFQQHFNNKFMRYMKSATLKALAIHTADEAGTNNGPDYKFGWGLLNASTAVQTISNMDSLSLIRELSLKNGETYSFQVYAPGTSALAATIVWTDPEGNPVPYALDPTTLMLVNDLDIRITKNNSSWYPWILNPASPANAATTGDNYRDNVEKIWIQNPTVGNYTINVSHKGNLQSLKQDFSLVVTGITLNSPIDFKATTISNDTIKLNWKLKQNKAVLLTWSDSANFGQPLDNVTYSIGQLINGGGKVIYSGTDTSFIHSNLIGNTKYHYRIWTLQNPSPTYSLPAIADAQTICTPSTLPFYENFSGTVMPGCWSQQNIFSQAGWEITNSNYAGGDSLELMHLWEDVSKYINGGFSTIPVSRMVLPVMNTIGITNLKLSFRNFYRDHQGWGGNGAVIKIQSSSDGIVWNNESWSHTSGNGDVGPGIETLSIANNLNKPKTYLAFTLEGNFYHIWYWSVDNIRAYEPNKLLSLKLYPEGLYNSTTNQLNKVQDENGNHFTGDTADVITVKLASKQAPYSINTTYQTSIDTSGHIQIELSPSITDSSYIVINHRNHIETWSAIPISFASYSINYDFTTAASKAYGDNLKNITTNQPMSLINQQANLQNNITELKNFAYNPARFKLMLKPVANSNLIEVVIIDKTTNKTYQKFIKREDFTK